MRDTEQVWKQFCEAAEGIRERFGLDDALQYLVGGKLLNYLVAVEYDSEFGLDLTEFVAEIKRIFTPEELERYFEKVSRGRAQAPAPDAETIEALEEEGVFDPDPVQEAEAILRVEHAKELLL